MRISGRLVRPARLRATLRPVRTTAATAGAGLAASFIAERVGAPVRARGAAEPTVRRLPHAGAVRGLRPGAYALELRAPERRARDRGALRLTRHPVEVDGVTEP